jgi:hypothetical protein
MSLKTFLAFTVVTAWNWGAWAFLINIPFSVSVIIILFIRKMTYDIYYYIVSASTILYHDYLEIICLFICGFRYFTFTEDYYPGYW